MSGPYWTDTFNPVVGCTPCSPGCKNCWAKDMRERFHSTPFSDVRLRDRLTQAIADAQEEKPNEVL